jgi:hypothetical protein
MNENNRGQLKVRFTLARPCLQHNTILIDPTHPWTKENKNLQATKKKLGKKQDTSGIEAQILKLQYLACAYWDDNDGFYMPTENIERCIREGAAKNKLGKQVEAGLEVVEDLVPFQGLENTLPGKPKYPSADLSDLEGVAAIPVPKELEKIYDQNYLLETGYVFKRPVRIPPRTGPRVMFHRPMIPTGAFLEFTVEFDKSVITEVDTKKAIEDAGKFVGLGVWRPKFGRFFVEFIKEFTK